MSKVKTNIPYENLEDFFLSGYFQEIKPVLTEYIAKELGIKKESARRNLNRMYNYYADTGRQARSGKEYIPIIQKFLQNMNNSIMANGGEFVGIFPSEMDAMMYKANLPVLHIAYTEKFEPYIYRFYGG